MHADVWARGTTSERWGAAVCRHGSGTHLMHPAVGPTRRLGGTLVRNPPAGDVKRRAGWWSGSDVSTYGYVRRLRHVIGASKYPVATTHTAGFLLALDSLGKDWIGLCTNWWPGCDRHRHLFTDRTSHLIQNYKFRNRSHYWQMMKIIQIHTISFLFFLFTHFISWFFIVWWSTVGIKKFEEFVAKGIILL